MFLHKLLQTKGETVLNLSNKSTLPSSESAQCSHSNPISRCWVFAINNRFNNTDALAKVKLTMGWQSLMKVVRITEGVW